MKSKSVVVAANEAQDNSVQDVAPDTEEHNADGICGVRRSRHGPGFPR
ncbi:hypothetical protein Sinac_6297 [Singulisphaera acidiphila DSM 18658]|uniref:Uncharacterized protein n=1 Tax=Singulisphaera acidiphila (strain ATCC BAA-1392 / DSM 18658 / VKM B-2454 / MOB10) TaxID=886293 RepID=L0DLZ2_SINAD|nr:hypothetical protein Sinac_6297 [Singulisphaera acidiphila DSM 18658]